MGQVGQHFQCVYGSNYHGVEISFLQWTKGQTYIQADDYKTYSSYFHNQLIFCANVIFDIPHAFRICASVYVQNLIIIVDKFLLENLLE